MLLAAGAPAQAFYWYDWPGSQPRTLLVPPSQAQPFPLNPPEPEPGSHMPPPPVGPPVPVDKPPVGPPTHTPEPATGLLGLLGLGAAAAVRKWRKKK